MGVAAMARRSSTPCLSSILTMEPTMEMLTLHGTTTTLLEPKCRTLAAQAVPSLVLAQSTLALIRSPPKSSTLTILTPQEIAISSEEGIYFDQTTSGRD